jgi:hypothetical protein
MVQKAFILASLQVVIAFFLVIEVTITAFLIVQGLVKKLEQLVCPAL